MEERLKRILGDVFEMEAAEISDDSSPETIPLWDSLHHLKMITEFETVFEVRFTMKEVHAMTTFSKIREVLAIHLDGRDFRQERGD